MTSTSPPERAAPLSSPAGRFGERGEFVVTAELGLAASYSHVGAGASVTRVAVAPALAYFVAPRVSLGGSVFVSYSDASSDYDTAKTTALGVAADIGYAVPLGRFVSWWPLLRLGYSSNHTKTTLNVVSSSEGLASSPSPALLENTTRQLYSEVFLPFLIHPAEHFFVGFGPFFETAAPLGARSANDQFLFTVGAGTTIGGWW